MNHSDNSSFDSRVRVKVCGITRADDARAFDELGIDYLGFNFWPGSKRYITPEAAAPIISSLRHAVPVGVFVDQSALEIARNAAITGIKVAQLHGSEGWETVKQIALPIIKAIPQTGLNDWGGLRDGWDEGTRPEAHGPEFFLVDTATASAFGGTGTTFDWTLLGKPDGSSMLPRPLFLAGGLGPHNLAEAVRIARPFGLFGVDLNSKVETAPGVKDVEAVRRCVELIRNMKSER